MREGAKLRRYNKRLAQAGETKRVAVLDERGNVVIKEVEKCTRCDGTGWETLVPWRKDDHEPLHNPPELLAQSQTCSTCGGKGYNFKEEG